MLNSRSVTGWPFTVMTILSSLPGFDSASAASPLKGEEGLPGRLGRTAARPKAMAATMSTAMAAMTRSRFN